MGMFKLRYSYGKVGNDYVSEGGARVRFPYLPTFKTDDLFGYNYGDIGTNIYYYTGLTYATLASKNVTWEVSKKHDVGLDFSLFGDN